MRAGWISCWTSWACFAACAGGAAAGEADSTNGIFGRGSYVGSDHWLSTLTQSALAEAASRRLEKGTKGGGALDDAAREDADTGCFRMPACRTDGRAAPADEVWVRPAPDGCWKRPVLARPIAGPEPEDVVGSPPSGGSRLPAGTGSGYRPPESDRGTTPFASDGRSCNPPGTGEVQGPPWPLPPHCPGHTGPPAGGGGRGPGDEVHEDEVEEEDREGPPRSQCREEPRLKKPPRQIVASMPRSICHPCASAPAAIWSKPCA